MTEIASTAVRWPFLSSSAPSINAIISLSSAPSMPLAFISRSSCRMSMEFRGLSFSLGETSSSSRGSAGFLAGMTIPADSCAAQGREG